MKELVKKIEKKLDEYLPVNYPEEIFDSMRYSLLAGGKRLRPIMCLEACKVFGGDVEKAMPTACAFEMLHTQSLIHDDLPCMDNDDYRRGQLTNHKKFSESTAVLAGDALISYGTQLIIEKSELPASTILKVIREHAIAAGAYGIIAGQIVDIAMEGKPYDEKTLQYIHTHKTADLFKAVLKAGAIIANATNEQIQAMEDFGQKLGFAFQICDDVLDEISTFEEMGKTLGKDKNAGKLTYTALFGLEKAKCEVNCLLNEAYDILKKQGINSEIFNTIINSIREKVNR
ncbi:polyprenyl synthetase family protein [bacterium]|nr:polyprenyl synthetase family protein [bacterium]